jgi:hypothetical protein
MVGQASKLRQLEASDGGLDVAAQLRLIGLLDQPPIACTDEVRLRQLPCAWCAFVDSGMNRKSINSQNTYSTTYYSMSSFVLARRPLSFSPNPHPCRRCALQLVSCNCSGISIMLAAAAAAAAAAADAATGAADMISLSWNASSRTVARAPLFISAVDG